MDNKIALFPVPSSQFKRDPESELDRLKEENKQLRNDLSFERKLRYDAEQKLKELKTLPVCRRKKNINTPPKEYSEFKSDGKRKAHAAEPIRSYDDFIAIKNYFLHKNQYRNAAMWVTGVCTGGRISDLLNLKVTSVFNDDFSFRERIFLIEQKTGKLNNCLITEAIQESLTQYMESIGWALPPSAYLFPSGKTKEKMKEECGWRILSDCGKALNLPINLGSHTMRNSFANIVACVDKSVVDMNSITKIQGLLNHSDPKCTMRYLKTFRTMYDKARITVSDFTLGKTDVNTLVAGTSHSIDQLFAKMEELENTINGMKQFQEEKHCC